MRRALIAVAAILVLAAAVVGLAPASLVGVAIEDASGRIATIAAAEGTIWRGTGTLAARGGLRMPLAWTIDPLSLARGKLRFRLEPATAASPRAIVELHRDGFAAQDLDIAIPASSVRAFAPKLGATLDGDVRIVASSIGWTAQGWSGGAKVDWRGARIAVGEGPAIDFGTVAATLDAAGGRLAGPLSNVGGDVEARGTLAVSAIGAPETSLTLVPRRDDPALASALAALRLAGGPLRVDVAPR